MDDPPPHRLAQRASRQGRKGRVGCWETLDGEGAAWGGEVGGVAEEGAEEVLVDGGGGGVGCLKLGGWEGGEGVGGERRVGEGRGGNCIGVNE